MPYTTPTAEEFRTRFPAFAAISDTVIDTAIAEAGQWVDTSWLEQSYQPAVMYYAAHLMVMEGVLGTVNPSSPGVVTSEKLGDAQTNYAAPPPGSPGSVLADFQGTVYGRRYLQLLKVNQPAVAVL